MKPATDASNKSKLTFQVISDPSEILKLSDETDIFVNQWSPNPLLLRGFISQFMNSTRASGWKPTFLLIKSKEKIVGTAPLMIKTQFGFRFCEFLLEDWLSPDFVLDSKYRDLCIGCVFEYLFKRMNCHFVKFYLPAESPNLVLVGQQCMVYGDVFTTRDQSSHCFIPVDCSWSEFQHRKARHRKIRQIERKLDDLGPWKVECIQNLGGQQETVEKILEVENRSWKRGVHNGFGTANIEQLLMTLEGIKTVANFVGFKCKVWFLNIGHEAVAYTLVIKYKGTGFLLKTSYDKRYAKSYVGKYINNVAIRDMFKDEETEIIDFMASYPFMSFWTAQSSKHIGFSVCSGKLASLVERWRDSPPILRAWNLIFCNRAYLRLKSSLWKNGIFSR